mgnify:CR=1 FL=1
MTGMLEQELVRILGRYGGVRDGPASTWSRASRDRYGETPLGVARPASTEEVSLVLAACHAAGVAVVPQGGIPGSAVLRWRGGPGR